MTYTDGKYLIADTIRELHWMANRLGVPYSLFMTSPFPHYHVDHNFQQEMKEAGIKTISPSFSFSAVEKDDLIYEGDSW